MHVHTVSLPLKSGHTVDVNVEISAGRLHCLLHTSTLAAALQCVCWMQCCFVGRCNVFICCWARWHASCNSTRPPDILAAAKQPLLRNNPSCNTTLPPHTCCCHITFAAPRPLRARRRNPRNSPPYIPPHQHVGCDMHHMSHTCPHTTRHMSHRRFDRHRLCRRGLTRVRPPTPFPPCIFVPLPPPFPLHFCNILRRYVKLENGHCCNMLGRASNPRGLARVKLSGGDVGGGGTGSSSSSSGGSSSSSSGSSSGGSSFLKADFSEGQGAAGWSGAFEALSSGDVYVMCHIRVCVRVCTSHVT